MMKYILKPNPERDLYAYWSTVVDNILDAGDREYFARYYASEKILDRTDAKGSSYGITWPLWVSNTNRQDRGLFTLEAWDLEAYVDHWVNGDLVAAEALLVPYSWSEL